jgi:arabinan endo-1,5-alpha-L-arabinosidase
MGSSTGPLLLSALSLALCACQASKDVVASSYGEYDPARDTKPVIHQIDGNISTTDPFLFYWQGTYYVFSSGFTNPSGAGLDLRSSKNLIYFNTVKAVLSPNPQWVEKKLAKVTILWNPSVLAWDGTIHLFYAASWYGSERACIGHATTKSMDKPFVDDEEPVICSNVESEDPFIAIDPAATLDDAGNPWLVFGSGGNGINIIALDRQGRRLDPQSSPHVIAARPNMVPIEEFQAIQATSVYRWRNHYYLFASFDWPPNHILRVGRAERVTGPYVARDGTAMVTGGGTLVLQGNDYFSGPGSNMVFDNPEPTEEADKRFNVYHAYNATGDIVLRIGQLLFDNEGWPVSGGP